MRIVSYTLFIDTYQRILAAAKTNLLGMLDGVDTVLLVDGFLIGPTVNVNRFISYSFSTNA